MAVYKLFPVKDTSIYSLYPNLNSGLDEIIECSTRVNDEYDLNTQASRFLVSFSQTEINDVLTNEVGASTWSSSLNVFLADGEGFSDTVALEFYPVSASWNMGTGKFLDNPEITDGASWNYRTSFGDQIWRISNFGQYVTASFAPSYPGGGTWYTGSSISGLNVVQTQSFTFYSTGDINVDVTDTVKAWVSGAFENNGFIVKQQNEFVTSSNDANIIQYFSVDTNTIYPPCLEIKWDDHTYNTGSLTVLNTPQCIVSVTNNAGEYFNNAIEKFRVNARPEFPTRVFSTSSLYTDNFVLPSSSYFAIKDLDTNEFVIDFDTQFTKLSADVNGSYFNLYMNGLQPERYYKILIKTIIDGATLVLDDNNYFKVVNG
jgi:hypothetical protein